MNENIHNFMLSTTENILQFCRSGKMRSCRNLVLLSLPLLHGLGEIAMMLMMDTVCQKLGVDELMS